MGLPVKHLLQNLGETLSGLTEGLLAIRLQRDELFPNRVGLSEDRASIPLARSILLKSLECDHHLRQEEQPESRVVQLHAKRLRPRRVPERSRLRLRPGLRPLLAHGVLQEQLDQRGQGLLKVRPGVFSINQLFGMLEGLLQAPEAPVETKVHHSISSQAARTLLFGGNRCFRGGLGNFCNLCISRGCLLRGRLLRGRLLRGLLRGHSRGNHGGSGGSGSGGS
mmetsp:Transcript_28401/g.81574  ORF Transcript_28401/g.81574 Transcript_28401/m.81574 type:complete len:223 (+) Transcript_28401:614-1282(+)